MNNTYGIKCENFDHPFDNRLPHSTSSILSRNDTREVIYFSYIPKLETNIKYKTKYCSPKKY